MTKSCLFECTCIFLYIEAYRRQEITTTERYYYFSSDGDFWFGQFVIVFHICFRPGLKFHNQIQTTPKGIPPDSENSSRKLLNKIIVLMYHEWSCQGVITRASTKLCKPNMIFFTPHLVINHVTLTALIHLSPVYLQSLGLKLWNIDLIIILSSLCFELTFAHFH